VGETLEGALAWAPHVAQGTTRGRERPFVLAGGYLGRWQPFSKDAGRAGEFRALVIEVGAP